MSNFLLNSPRCVFIHIPKTAGTSIRQGFFRKNYQGPVFGSIPPEWQDEFSFAFVRNPYDRLISGWKMFTRGTEQLKEQFPNISLKDFLDIVMDENIIYDERRKTYEERIRHHMIPQTHPFNCLHLAKFVGRVENLNEDFRNICEIIGVDYKPLEKMHYSKRRNYSEYFDRETIKLTEAYYAEDLNNLKYQF